MHRPIYDTQHGSKARKTTNPARHLQKQSRSTSTCQTQSHCSIQLTTRREGLCTENMQPTNQA